MAKVVGTKEQRRLARWEPKPCRRRRWGRRRYKVVHLPLDKPAWCLDQIMKDWAEMAAKMAALYAEEEAGRRRRLATQRHREARRQERLAARHPISPLRFKGLAQ